MVVTHSAIALFLICLLVFCLKLTGMLRPMATEIASKIDELVRMGVGKVNEMCRHLKYYIEKELFPDPSKRPLACDSAYFPDNHAVAQKICASKMQLR